MSMFQKELLPVISATLVASVLIILTGNSVAETASTTEQATQKQLPPPGPFNLWSTWGTKSKVKVAEPISPPVQSEKPVEPTGPFNLWSSWGSKPKVKAAKPVVPISPPVQPEKPVEPTGPFNLWSSWGSRPKVKVAEPVAPMSPLKSDKPTGSGDFWSSWGSKLTAAPVSPPVQPEEKPEAPKKIATKPEAPEMAQQAPAMPTANAMPHINNPTQSQQPQGFNGRLPQMQQYQYIPLPIYRANLGYPVTPVYGGHVITPIFNRAIPQKPKAISK